jgi:murein DD-endopeptidase MepM/ murein hydrolase activator NlpD
MSRMHVEEGQSVRRGDLLGAVGNTGRSTGPHLHYEVRLNGIPVDPSRYILE